MSLSRAASFLDLKREAGQLCHVTRGVSCFQRQSVSGWEGEAEGAAA